MYTSEIRSDGGGGRRKNVRIETKDYTTDG
jgi:hypothetical protein